MKRDGQKWRREGGENKGRRKREEGGDDENPRWLLPYVVHPASHSFSALLTKPEPSLKSVNPSVPDFFNNLLLIPHVTLWPWPLTLRPWTFVVYRLWRDQSLYHLFAKLNNPRPIYWWLNKVSGPIFGGGEAILSGRLGSKIRAEVRIFTLVKLGNKWAKCLSKFLFVRYIGLNH